MIKYNLTIHNNNGKGLSLIENDNILKNIFNAISASEELPFIRLAINDNDVETCIIKEFKDGVSTTKVFERTNEEIENDYRELMEVLHSKK